MSIISQYFSKTHFKMHKKEKPFGFSLFAVIYFGSKQSD